MEDIKCVVVGDTGVGKSSILISYTKNGFPGSFVPTTMDSFSTNVMVDSKRISLSLWDTAGEEDFDRLRPLSYPQTDIFIACFSLVDRATLENVESKWLPELSFHGQNAPILVVGNKLDLREDALAEHEKGEGPAPVLTEEGEQFVAGLADLPIAGYVECSALTQRGLRSVFESAIRAALKANDSERKNGASLLTRLEDALVGHGEEGAVGAGDDGEKCTIL